MIRYIPVFMLLIAGAFMCVVLLSPATREQLSPSDLGMPLPAIHPKAWEGKDDLMRVAQGRITVINFFSSWCVSCRVEHEALLALAHQFPGVAFEGIVWNDTREHMKDWLDNNRSPYTRLWMDTRGDAAITLGVRGIPETFILDQDGIVRYHLAGPIGDENALSISNLLKNLGAKRAPLP